MPTQLCYGNITVVLKILLNKATSGCSFVNLRLIYTIFCILVNNDIVAMSHQCGCHVNHFGGKDVTIVNNIGIINP